MAWQDRDYHREGRNTEPGDGVLGLLSMGISAGSYFGIRVRIHITFFIYAVITLIDAAAHNELAWRAMWVGLVFGSVLLHEFGHCFGCRSVGGRADDILIWPLGGLAQTNPPHRPWAALVTTACGPLVNLVIAAVTYAVLCKHYGDSVSRFYSLNPMRLGAFFYFPGWIGFVGDLFVVNYALFVFNMLLVFMPFDAGRLMQELMWFKMGWGRSMYNACKLGMAFAILAGIFGLATGRFLVAMLAVSGFIYCYQQLQSLPSIQEAMSSQWGSDEVWEQDRIVPKKRSIYARWRAKRAEAKLEQTRKQEAEAEAEVDRILAKVKAQGLHSLTEKEKTTLRRDTERRNRAG
jgi:stage IV sporulation protein FB